MALIIKVMLIVQVDPEVDGIHIKTVILRVKQFLRGRIGIFFIIGRIIITEKKLAKICRQGQVILLIDLIVGPQVNVFSPESPDPFSLTIYIPGSVTGSCFP